MRPLGRLVAGTVALLGAAWAVASPAAAMPSTTPLSPLLSELARPAVRALSPARQAARLNVAAEGPGSLVREGGQVVVQARFDHGAIAAREDLEAAGGEVLDASRRYQSSTVSVSPADLRALAAVPGLASLTPVRRPMLFSVNCEGGSVISEGVAQMHANEAREAFDVRGKGLTVGILSDSFNAATEAADGSGPVATHAKQDIATADLPGPAGTCSDQQVATRVLEEGPSEEAADEGRAMAQIVHDVAPHAQLAFASAFTSEESFAQNIERLARPVASGGAGASVIADDVAWFEEPYFQDGPVAAAINRVTGEGVTYLTAAGNDNLFDGANEIASWEAPEYRDSGGCPIVLSSQPTLNAHHCMDFNPGVGTDRTFGITVEAGETLTVDLQWAEAWNGVGTDIDAFLLSESGTEVLAASTEDNPGKTQRPVEIVQWTNESALDKTVNFVVNRFSGTSPRLKFILLQNGGGVSATEYEQSEGGDVVGPAIFGHAGAASAISAGAINYGTTTAPEFYSSRGPVTHYFGPVEGSGAAAELLTPEEVSKPDIVATDCGATTFFAHQSAGVWRFCGTSAAAPHAAAVAALLRQAEPTASVQQIRESLIETADPVGAFGADAVGHGLVNARAALESLPSPLAVEDGPSSIVAPLETEAETVVPATSTTTTPVTPAVAPSTSFLRRPPSIVWTRFVPVKVIFRFGADQGGVTFLCKLDRQQFHNCAVKQILRVGLGTHTMKVKARSAAGLVDASPASFRFRVKRFG